MLEQTKGNLYAVWWQPVWRFLRNRNMTQLPHSWVLPQSQQITEMLAHLCFLVLCLPTCDGWYNVPSSLP